jgi:hypothetical protein
MCSISFLTSEHAFGILACVDRTQVRLERLGAVVVAGLLAMGMVGARTGAGSPRPSAARVYVVRPGDTLWGIAVRAAGPQADPRPTVDRLIAANHLGNSTITPGERLSLP